MALIQGQPYDTNNKLDTDNNLPIQNLNLIHKKSPFLQGLLIIWKEFSSFCTFSANYEDVFNSLEFLENLRLEIEL
jgi:hypothetical protein